jgi:hypothetical protein
VWAGLILGTAVLAPKKKKDDDDEDGKRYDWAIVLGGTKWVSSPFDNTQTQS